MLLVGVGGLVGSMLRYLLSGYVQQLTRSTDFPYGTLFVNVVGCLVVGFLSALAESRGVLSVETRAFLIVGILGGFTTFSTFSNETLNLLRDGQNSFALVNVGLSLGLGLGAVWAGRVLAGVIWG